MPELTEYEKRYCTSGGQAGILALRGMESDKLLALARAEPYLAAKGKADALANQAYVDVVAKTGPKTNPSWVTSTAASEAYYRDLIDAREMDWLTQ